MHKITVIPHGHAALGYTMQLPAEDHHLMSRSALLDKIKGQLGGRAAEEVVFHEISTGGENAVSPPPSAPCRLPNLPLPLVAFA